MLENNGKIYLELLSDRVISVLSVTQLVRLLGRSEAWIFIPVYLSVIRGVPYFYIGFLFFITAVITLPVSIFGGNLIDHLGRRRVGLIMPPLLVLVFLLLSAGAFLNWPLYAIISAFIVVQPLVTMQGTVDDVLVTDLVEESKRNDAFSLLRIAANLGFSIGPAVGGFLALINYGLIFLMPGIISAVEFVLFYLYIQEPKHDISVSGNFSFPSGDRKFIVISVLLAAIWFVAGQWGTTLTLFWTNLDHIGTGSIGILYGLNGVVVVVMQIPINMVMRNVKDHTRIAIGGLVYAFSFLGMAFNSNMFYLLFLVFLLTLGENIVSPVVYSLIGKIAPPSKRAQYFGAFQAMACFSMALAPLMGTYLLGRLASQILFFWSIIAGMGAIISIAVFSYGKRVVSS